MVPIEGSGCDIVEAVIIDPRQPVSPARIGPYLALEGGLDLGELLLCRLGIYDIEDAPLAVAVFDRVEDLRNTAVEGIGEQFAGMPALGAPNWKTCRVGMHDTIVQYDTRNDDAIMLHRDVPPHHRSSSRW